MALTPAEKQKAYRERKKAEAESAKRKGGDDAAEYFNMPFSEFAQEDGNIGDCDLYMALAGMRFPSFYDERNANDFVIDREEFNESDLFGAAQGALGRAEIVMDCLIDTAATLAEAINRYKQSEINARIAELERSSDVDRAAAIQEAVRLNKILDLLKKQVRIPFPQWKVTGV